MSEATRDELARRQAAEEQQRAVVAALKRDCLASVADALPGKLDEYAKSVVLKRPEVAQQLGSDGIGALRKELAAAGNELAEEIRGAAEQIQWPDRRLEAGLFNFMYGQRMVTLDAIFNRHGFTTAAELPGILPQQLIDKSLFSNLESAIPALKQAEIETASAEKAHERATVESLWDQSN